MDGVLETEDGNYVVTDSTTGGYVDRMTGYANQNWKTTWDTDLNLISLVLDRKEMLTIVNEKQKDDFDYHRSVRARNRHLKLLKDYLGIEYKKTAKNEKESVILIERSYTSNLDPIRIRDVVMKNKTLVLGNFNHKKSDMYLAEVTPENEKLINEYNEKLKEFKDYKASIFKKLFED